MLVGIATTYTILHGDPAKSVINEKATSWRSGKRDQLTKNG